MKYTSFFKFVLIGIVCALVSVSCVKEGPMGPPGEDGDDGSDGRDGVDGNVTCLACHSSENIESISAEFAMSGHYAGEAVGYPGSRYDCAACHSHEGFVQFAEVEGLRIDSVNQVSNPSPWECSTCHGLHETFETTDYALRLSDPINPIYNEETTMDLGGSSNLCANCHQSRDAEPMVTSPGEETFEMKSTHYGPHYSTQSNVVAGVGMAEIEGSVAYPEAGTADHLEQASCTGCHMGEYGNGGGHSWKPNLDACNSCHNTDLDDFNYGGVQTDVKDKLAELAGKLLEAGVIDGNEQDGYSQLTGEYPMVVARAYFNWKGLKEDRSYGAHNPKYVNALLTNTLEALEASE